MKPQEAKAEPETQHARLHQTATQNTQLWEVAFDAMRDAIALLDRDRRVIRVNHAFTQLVHKTRRGVLGQTIDALLEGVVCPQPVCPLEATWKNGWPEMCVHEYEGRIYEVQTSPGGREVTGGSQSTTPIVYLMRDVSVRKVAEHQLRLQAAAVQSADSAIVITDCTGKIQWVNPAFTRLTGYTAAEVMLGQAPPLFVSNSQDPAFDQNLWETIHAGQVCHREANSRRKDGSAYAEEVTITPVRDEHGQISNFIAIKQDITERKQAEWAVAAANDELERTLLHANQLAIVAEEANVAKSEFLANMSHEIRTPLNGVIGMTALLLDTKLTPEQQDYTETIRTSGETLLALINDILDFSKIEAGKLELENRPFDLRACIESALDLLTPKAAEKGLNLAYTVEDQTPNMLIGDVTRLRQILVNLLGNAVKFTESGEVVISVTGRPQAENGHEIQLVVKDTGIGIPPDRTHRLFQSFSQVDASTTRKYGGTGLGLAISKRLSELMGGTMWVESDGVPGEGSAFHVTILAGAAPDQPPPYLHQTQPELAGKQVLIVDDNATNRRILTEQVQFWTMQAHVAATGPEALELTRRQEPFDLAILDMQQAQMDSLTLATEIRKQPGCQALPLVIFSPLGQGYHKNETLDFVTSLTKPIKPAQLHSALIGIVTGHAPRAGRYDRQSQLDPEMGQRHPLRILLAEDNLVNQKVAMRLLQKMGYHADLAANGLEVLEALKLQPYDVILMDVQMPEMDGVQATNHIRKQWPADQQPRIIALTAHALSESRQRFLNAGMDDYLSKPIRVDELSNVMGKCRVHADQVEIDTAPPPVEPAPDAAIDSAVLEEFRAMMGEDGAEVVAELISIFLEDTPNLLADLQQAVAQEDAKALNQAAHTFKSNSATFGAITLSDMCKELEAMGRAGTIKGAAEKVAQVEIEYERVTAALKEEYAELSQQTHQNT